jgi:hypothetical protein
MSPTDITIEVIDGDISRFSFFPKILHADSVIPMKPLMAAAIGKPTNISTC